MSGFAGHGSAWFDLQEVTRFANELLAFSLPENNPPCIEGGYWSDDWLVAHKEDELAFP